jgi:hypothetical protein
MRKNLTTQEKIIIAFMGFVTLTFLFPPFVNVYKDGILNNAGYSFILLPPKGDWVVVPVVNLGTLIAEWVFAFILAAAAWQFVTIRNSSQKS